MKLKPNMYARVKELNDVIIVKVLGVVDDGFKADNNMFYMLSEIIKASHNIIDLIEVGDYVNGYKVVSKGTVSSESNNVYLEILTKNLKNFWNNKIFEQEIKTILTKEQFENNCFRIGD